MWRVDQSARHGGFDWKQRALKTAMCGVNGIGSHDYLTAQMLHRFITQVAKLYRWHHCFSISRYWFNNKAIFVAQFPWKKSLLAGNKSFGTRFWVLLNFCWQIKINSDWRNIEEGSVDRGRRHWVGGEMWMYMWMICMSWGKPASHVSIKGVTSQRGPVFIWKDQKNKCYSCHEIFKASGPDI